MCHPVRRDVPTWPPDTLGRRSVAAVDALVPAAKQVMRDRVVGGRDAAVHLMSLLRPVAAL